MSTASLSFIKFDPATASFQSRAKQFAEKGRTNLERFATYVPVDGEGVSVTVVLHDEGSDKARGAESVEEHSRKHPGTGAAALTYGSLGGISNFHCRTVNMTHHGEAAEPKPYALVFAVSYDADKADNIREAGKALNEYKSSLRYHLIRKDDIPGHALVVVPVNSLDEHDAPAGEGAKCIIDVLKDAVTSVTLIKMKRVAEYSS